MNSLRCANCGFVNFASAARCKRCGSPPDSLIVPATVPPAPRQSAAKGSRVASSLLRILGVTLLLLFLWHISLVATSEPVSPEGMRDINRAIDVLDSRGFGWNAFVLRYAVRFRSTDSWLNERAGHDTAYAATNFPFEVVTIYDDFYAIPRDDVERAVVLLHESYHLAGYGERGAFERVWRHKRQLGWTAEKYGETPFWKNVAEATRHHAPHLFTCGPRGTGDCLE